MMDHADAVDEGYGPYAATCEPNTVDSVRTSALADEVDPSDVRLASSLLEAMIGSHDDGLILGMMHAVLPNPISARAVVESPALLEAVLAIAEQSLESCGPATARVSVWMAEHNGEMEALMARMAAA